MSLDPLLQAGLLIQAHVVTVLTAVALTPAILILRKGTALHRMLGRAWAFAMIATATVALFIDTLDSPIHFNPIHIFSVIVLWSVPRAIYHIRNGNVAEHRAAMLGVTYGGIGLAGAFALLPGRVMHAAVFGG
ncbi:MAG: DUF2306 domain-containing protein [Pseudomonadota bacterium]